MNVKKIVFTLSTLTLCLGVTKIHAQLIKLDVPDAAVGQQITQALQNNAFQTRIEILQSLIAQEEENKTVLKAQTQQALLLAIIELFNQRTKNPDERNALATNLLNQTVKSPLFKDNPEFLKLIKYQLLPYVKSHKEIILVTNITIDPKIQDAVKSNADLGVIGFAVHQKDQNGQAGPQASPQQPSNQPNNQPKASQPQPAQEGALVTPSRQVLG